MRREEDYGGHPFLSAFPTLSLLSARGRVYVYTLLTVKGAHRFTSATVIIRFSLETMALRRCLSVCMRERERVAIFIAILFLFFPAFFRAILLSLRYNPDICSISFVTNVRFTLDSKLFLFFSPSVVYLLIYLATSIFSRYYESSRREFSRLKFYRYDDAGAN